MRSTILALLAFGAAAPAQLQVPLSSSSPYNPFSHSPPSQDRPGRDDPRFGAPELGATFAKFAASKVDPLEAAAFSPVVHSFDTLREDVYSTLAHPAYPRHSVRIKKSHICDGCVKCVVFPRDRARHAAKHASSAAHTPAISTSRPATSSSTSSSRVATGPRTTSSSGRTADLAARPPRGSLLSSARSNFHDPRRVLIRRCRTVSLYQLFVGPDPVGIRLGPARQCHLCRSTHWCRLLVRGSWRAHRKLCSSYTGNTELTITSPRRRRRPSTLRRWLSCSSSTSRSSKASRSTWRASRTPGAIFRCSRAPSTTSTRGSWRPASIL
jgi:hypothetical protein